jgi:hypothetical protein
MATVSKGVVVRNSMVTDAIMATSTVLQRRGEEDSMTDRTVAALKLERRTTSS